LHIDKKLNLVVPIERDDGTVIYVHSEPLDNEVFERYFLVLSKAFAMIYAEGLTVIAGPRVAALVLKKVAMDMGAWEGEGGVDHGLMNEIRRLSNVIVPTPAGWQTMPLHNAKQDGTLTAEEVGEAEGQIAFFMLTSALNKRRQLLVIMAGVNRLWGAQTTLSNSTEYAASLRTLTEGANIGENEAAKPLSHPF
jgi:hypothetical protein